jgi:TonB-linked SusC/RagA family outer membrane protein
MKKTIATSMLFYNRHWNKTFNQPNLRFLMKVSTCILLTVLVSSQILVAKESKSQGLSEKFITLELQNETLANALAKIESLSGFRIGYLPRLIEKYKGIWLTKETRSVERVLELVLANTDLDFKEQKSTILIFRNKKKPVNINAGSLNTTIDILNTVIEKTVTGTVKDAEGKPVPDVSVIVKQTSKGGTSDANGNYVIKIPEGPATLIFSSVGFIAQEVKVNDRSVIDIILVSVNNTLNDVVVVAYGTQKRANMTGSVATVSGTELIKRPVTNVANLLQGKVPGLQVVQSSGEPGNDNAVLRIRGLGTMSDAGNNPLVLVNGVQGTLSGLNPEDIESVSVLKDAASASIYGSRAANGVILVTTKQGRSGALSLEYSANYQLQQFTRQPKFITNSAEFMQDWNTANERANDIDYFSAAEIDAFKTSTDRIKYPNFDWFNHMIHNGNAQNHHISMNGGNDKTSFNFSAGYLDQDGLNKAFNFKRYNMLLNLTSKLNKVVTFGTNIISNYQDRVEPVMGSEEFMLLVYTAGPNYMPYLSDGSGKWTWRYSNNPWHNRNPEQALTYGDIKHNVYSAAAQSYVDVNLTKDLVFEVKGAVNYDVNFSKQVEHQVSSYFYKDNTLAATVTGYNPGVTNRNEWNILTTMYSTLNYTKTIATNHNLKVLAGYSQESNNWRYLYGHKSNYPSPQIYPNNDVLGELNAGSNSQKDLEGSSNAWAIRSYFGRLNYSFKDKYLLEANARYDGSSRIQKDHRWGLFPSVSVGWILSKENFMQGISWLDELKLRASQGRLGNQNIGNYPYQDILSLNSYAFGSSISQGAAVTRLTDKTIKWETTDVTDIGVDYSMKKGLFSVTADWFNKVTDDILYQPNIPASIGLEAPTVNYAKMKNTGFEIVLGHRNKIGQLQYNVTANFTTFKNTVLRVNSPSYGRTTIQEGLPWNSYYLTEWIGIFQSQDEIDKSPKHPYNPKPGDLKFKDQNGDGVIDDKDRVVVDGAFPKFFYGGSINLSWKNFDVSSFFQGVKGQKFYVENWGIDPFIQGNPPTVDFASKAWTPQNKSNTTPAMYRKGYAPVTGTSSTYYLKDASYFRLKNLTIGYNFDRNIFRRLGMKSLRVYVSGDNLLTVTKYPYADPERTGSGSFQTYPQLRIFAAGVNVKF